MQASTGWNTPGRHPESSAHWARNRYRNSGPSSPACLSSATRTGSAPSISTSSASSAPWLPSSQEPSAAGRVNMRAREGRKSWTSM